jgi:NADPH:quinone reductase-like Zn-dependent oxidoreductase
MCRAGHQTLCDTYRIIGEHVWGGMAQYLVVPAHRLHPKPERLSFVEAAAVPLAFQTAWRALVTRAALRPGEVVLVTGASGGVSTAAIQIARLCGAHVIAVTSSPEKADRVAALGAETVIDRTATPWSKAVWQATGKRGADVVIDSVGGETWRDVLRSAARLGRVVTYGGTAGPTAPTDTPVVFWKQLSILGSTMSNDDEFRAVLAEVDRGTLEPVVGAVLPLSEARCAHEVLESGDFVVKIVLEVS